MPKTSFFSTCFLRLRTCWHCRPTRSGPSQRSILTPNENGYAMSEIDLLRASLAEKDALLSLAEDVILGYRSDLIPVEGETEGVWGRNEIELGWGRCWLEKRKEGKDQRKRLIGTYKANTSKALSSTSPDDSRPTFLVPDPADSSPFESGLSVRLRRSEEVTRRSSFM
jgi:hypothetical protein